MIKPREYRFVHNDTKNNISSLVFMVYVAFQSRRRKEGKLTSKSSCTNVRLYADVRYVMERQRKFEGITLFIRYNMMPLNDNFCLRWRLGSYPVGLVLDATRLDIRNNKTVI